MAEYTKWVACWGNATSITDRRECTYAKDLTLRYPVRMAFSGSALRVRLSNFTGTEPVTVTNTYIAKQEGEYIPLPLSFAGEPSVTIEPGTEVESDPLPVEIRAGETVDVSLYLGEFTQMTAGTLVTGPLSKAAFCYGDHARDREFPADLSRSTSWFYFLNTIDILTEECNCALICYGDSITAQSWPDYLAIKLWEEGHRNISVIRRAICGTRVLREYSCIAYQAYGLKGATRFPVEVNAAGAKGVIIQHGINDIIHPVGVDVNPFRPWSDMPTLEDLKRGVEELYVKHARSLGLSVWCGTLLPIKGWRTYNEDRDALRCAFNDWLRTSGLFDGCIDFDLALRSGECPAAFAEGYDSGDHLHPSEKAYEAMAESVVSFEKLLLYLEH